MSISITPTNIPQPVQPLASVAGAGSKAGNFQGVLESVINHVEQSRATAEQMAKDFIAGDNEELHTVALASQRAELEFNLLLQIRNKAVSAYQEIMRMQV
jgi:flagellar hook-basal body complex protein FliE